MRTTLAMGYVFAIGLAGFALGRGVSGEGEAEIAEAFKNTGDAYEVVQKELSEKAKALRAIQMKYVDMAKSIRSWITENPADSVDLVLMRLRKARCHYRSGDPANAANDLRLALKSAFINEKNSAGKTYRSIVLEDMKLMGIDPDNPNSIARSSGGGGGFLIVTNRTGGFTIKTNKEVPDIYRMLDKYDTNQLKPGVDLWDLDLERFDVPKTKSIEEILKELGYPDLGKTGWGGIKPDRDPLGSLGGGTKPGGGLRGGLTGGSE